MLVSVDNQTKHGDEPARCGQRTRPVWTTWPISCHRHLPRHTRHSTGVARHDLGDFAVLQPREVSKITESRPGRRATLRRSWASGTGRAGGANEAEWLASGQLGGWPMGLGGWPGGWAAGRLAGGWAASRGAAGRGAGGLAGGRGWRAGGGAGG